MKSLLLSILFSVVLLSCQKTDTTTQKPVSSQTEDTSALDLLSALAGDSLNRQTLALSGGALQLVNGATGSATEIPFGTPMNEIMTIMATALQSQPTNVGVNNKCAAGPLTIAKWKNGLTLTFQENKTDSVGAKSDWKFVGWSLAETSGKAQRLTTTDGYGIGTRRSEMEDGDEIQLTKMSMGYEFSAGSGLYGIFDGYGKRARIMALWSGITCNFR
jgi:hypothetical protein